MEIVKTIKEKIRVALSAALTEDEKKALADYHAKMESQSSEKKSIATKEGKTFNYVGELAKDTPLTMPSADGASVPAEDGEYEIDGDKVMVVIGGMVSEIKPKAMEEEKPQLGDKEMEAKLASQKSEIEASFEVKLSQVKEAHSKELNELKDMFKITYSALKKLEEMPIDTTEQVMQEKELTPAERYRLDKGLTI